MHAPLLVASAECSASEWFALGCQISSFFARKNPNTCHLGSCLCAPAVTAHANASLGCSVLSWKRRASFSYAIKVQRQISGQRGRVLLFCRGARDHALSAAIVGLGRTRRRLHQCKTCFFLAKRIGLLRPYFCLMGRPQEATRFVIVGIIRPEGQNKNEPIPPICWTYKKSHQNWSLGRWHGPMFLAQLIGKTTVANQTMQTV
jgi:hypothetical protein